MNAPAAAHARSFSTAKAPPAERSRLFQREMASAFSVGLAVQATGSDPLSAEVTGYRGRSLNFAALCFSPHATTSSPARDGKEKRVLVTLQKEGEAFVSQGGRESHVTPGSLFAVDLSRPFHIETGKIRTHSVYLPLEALRALVPQVDGLTAIAIDASGGVPAVFRAMLDELIAVAPSIDELAADRLADSIPHLLAAVLATHDRAGDVVPSALKLAHMQRLRRFVNEHLSDSTLDVDRIADGVNLSPRYVHRLFVDEGITCMRWVWGERLERCKKELLEPTLRSRSIGEIAYGWGFNDLAHFSRAFRERFGTSPRDLRARTPR